MPAIPRASFVAAASAKQSRPLLAIVVLMAGTLAVLLLLPPILQNQSYHAFADARSVLGVRNFWNVVSNIPFFLVGAVGLARCRHDAATTIVFGGIFLVGFGSSYYHLSPDDDTLFWDRLPMALAFMALLAGAIGERMSAKAGAILLWPLLGIAVLSLLIWRWSGDLRLYGWVQFFSRRDAAGYVPAASAEIHGHRLLDRRRDPLFARQAVRILRWPYLFYPPGGERPYAQAPCGVRGLLRHPAILSNAPAHRGRRNAGITVQRCLDFGRIAALAAARA
jgi:Ceramidase